MFGFRKFWIYVIVLVHVSLLLNYFGTRYALNWALTREAHSRGLDWAYHIEKKLPFVEGFGFGHEINHPTRMPDPNSFGAMLSDVFGVGHIYQFDYINVHCMCYISLVSEAPLQRDAHDHHHDHDHKKQALAAPSQDDRDRHPFGHEHLDPDAAEILSGHPHLHRSSLNVSFAQGVLTGEPTGKAGESVPGSDLTGAVPVNPRRYLLDPEFVSSIIARNEDAIFIRDGQGEHKPSKYAAVYHPVSIDGEVLYVLRVLVDLEDQAKRYGQFLIIASVLSLVMLSIAVAYPTRWYVESARRGRRSDQRAKYLANHDTLTNLYNRNNFHERVADMLWDTHEARKSALLFIFDLNGFKQVNDYFGHQTGDQLLCEFARVLKASAPEDAYIARLGGDEFVVLICGIEGDVENFSAHLNVPRLIELPQNDKAQPIEATVSGGVARYPADAQTTAELLQLADLALYEAKPNRQGEVRAYEPRMKKDFYDRLDLRLSFCKALEKRQIDPFYQPIVNMQTGKVEGFEALARWIHPERGVLTPAVFGDLFEDLEISALLGDLMFEKIVSNMVEWRDAGVPFESIGLNVTNGDLKRKAFSRSILDTLEAHDLKPNSLAIEVTENCFFGADKDAFWAHLKHLRDAGCYIALDDFGTGYSSITQLKQLPFTAVKIDKTFVENILDDEGDEAIVSALKDLGATMQFKLVLEGVETAEQLRFLSHMGFELAQGYYFSAPMPAKDVPAFVKAQNACGFAKRQIS